MRTDQRTSEGTAALALSRGRQWLGQIASGDAGAAIIIMSLTAIAVLLVCRAILLYQLGTRLGQSHAISTLARGTLFRMWQDVTVVTTVTLMSLMLVALGRSIAARVVHGLTLMLVVFMGAINVQLYQFYGSPNLGLVRFAGLSDLRALYTLLEYVSGRDLLLVSVACGIMLAASLGSTRLRNTVRRASAPLLLGGWLLLVAALIVHQRRLGTEGGR
jgi:hypothetical protein